MSGEAFTDRENETAKLVSNFQYGVNTFIVSPRRWGKTSLVKKVKGLAESEKLKIVYVDVQQCRCKEDFCERFASAVLSQTATKVNEWLENAKTFLGRFSFGNDAVADVYSLLPGRLRGDDDEDEEDGDEDEDGDEYEYDEEEEGTDNG